VNWSVETHSDDASIPEENKRFTFDIIQNATWSDGVPLTAKDVVFTLLFLRLMEPDFEFFKIKRHWSYNHLKAAYSPTPYRVVFEYSVKSYWLLPVFAYMKVLPAHIITDETITNEWDWSDWGPLFNSEHQLPTSGPFVYSGYREVIEGGQRIDIYNFTANPNYYYAPSRPEISATTPTTTSGTAMPPELTIAITFGSMLVIVVFIGEFIRLSPARKD
jgi:ABC-type transport system substrate-binding protein